MDKADYQRKIECPMCDQKLEVESVRYHTNGRKRVYWECIQCNISIMHRG